MTYCYSIYGCIVQKKNSTAFFHLSVFVCGCHVYAENKKKIKIHKMKISTTVVLKQTIGGMELLSFILYNGLQLVIIHPTRSVERNANSIILIFSLLLLVFDSLSPKTVIRSSYLYMQQSTENTKFRCRVSHKVLPIIVIIVQ